MPDKPERFYARERHPGHRDGDKSKEDMLASISAIAQLGHPALNPQITVDTSRAAPEVEPIVGEIINLLGTGLRA